MDECPEAGVFLNLDDCMALYSRLKAVESILSDRERVVLIRMEKLLYGKLSVKEMMDLLEKGSPASQGTVLLS